jgi:FdrA protein
MMLDAAGHQVIDLGDDFYTVGRPHPMIDPSLRNQLIADWVRSRVRVLLVDVVIGYGATADPAASLVRPGSRRAVRDSDQPLIAIATVTGTERDPQCRSLQIATLEDAGIAVVSSLPEAALLAAELIRPSQPLSHQSSPALLEKVAVINAGLRSFALIYRAESWCITSGRLSLAVTKTGSFIRTFAIRGSNVYISGTSQYCSNRTNLSRAPALAGCATRVLVNQ